MSKVEFQKGDQVVCINIFCLEGNNVAPPLKEYEEYEVNLITLDSQGNQHLDVGLKSKYSYIRSFETKEELPRGDEIHWCHPSRFVLKKDFKSKSFYHG